MVGIAFNFSLANADALAILSCEFRESYYLSYSGIACKYFPGIKQPIKINQIKTTPIIVIGTLRDPATPYSWAVALNKLITNSLLITLDGDGHTGHGRGSSCVDKTVDEYFITGKIPATDQKCDLSTAL